MRSTLLYVPDGFGSGHRGDAAANRCEAAAEGVASIERAVVAGVVLAGERDVDGLVHSHTWARADTRRRLLARMSGPCR
jgi:hypothetical protein